MNIISIFFTFCYYGLLCLGGGSSLTLIYIQDLVYGRNWMTLDQFSNFTAISQMTPGPIGINLATFFGYSQGGIIGGIASSAGLIFGPFFLMILTLIFLKKYRDTKVVTGILYGLTPAIFALMIASILIFLGFSVFTEQIPWGSFVKGKIPQSFGVNYKGLLIFIVSFILLRKTKISIFLLIFGATLIGLLLSFLP